MLFMRDADGNIIVIVIVVYVAVVAGVVLIWYKLMIAQLTVT